MEVCEDMFWSKPSIIYNYNSFYPSHNCKSNKVNSIIRILLLITLLSSLFLLFIDYNIVLVVGIALLFVLLIPVFVKIDQIKKNDIIKKEVKEAYTDFITNKAIEHDLSCNGKEYVIGTNNEVPWTEPTPNNPFMNILVPDFGYNPNKPDSLSVLDATVKQGLDDFFRTQWFSDPTDVFGKTQSQRQFIKMPSTSIPNDRKSFQDWLYKIPGKTCKEGGRQACLAGTDGSPVTWLNLSK
jgi:hypothetical protein